MIMEKQIAKLDATMLTKFDAANCGLTASHDFDGTSTPRCSDRFFIGQIPATHTAI